MDETIIVSETKALRVKTGEFHGKNLVTINQLWKKKDDTEWQYSKKNLTFSKGEGDAIGELISTLEDSRESLINHIS